MAYIRESVVETHFVNSAKADGWTVRKLTWVGRRHAPDRVIMRAPGRIVFVELKAPKGLIRAGQKREHKRLRDLGFEVQVLNTKQKVNEYFDHGYITG